jgi:squalene-hopene/tetraprenyl-beta-curcumene cyclase
MVDTQRLLRAYETARHDLLNERVAAGHWVGQLSSSALSTATAISALSLMEPHLTTAETPPGAPPQSRRGLIASGVRWLIDSQNADGGWGDTDKSSSNIATTMLVQSALTLAGVAAEHRVAIERADGYVAAQGGIAGLRRRYGIDKTFAVPILTNMALAGRVKWSEVSALPFEAACLPQSWYRFARLPVVSYAIPALVAIGQAKFHHDPPRSPLVRGIRRLAAKRSLEVLRQMQPTSGGYLEATPLTSFVVMSLASIGHANHPVARQGTEFLLASVRPDGSWPIDTNLATWLTSLSVHALSASDEPWMSHEMFDWVLGCQHRERHPFTGAPAGGWGWSDLSGAVPDADDTAGALVALRVLANDYPDADVVTLTQAVVMGRTWLLDLQNSDGGWPTFCRGWGKLPFDRSGDDLTAHALRALDGWRDPGTKLGARIDRAIGRGVEFLSRRQRSDGSWVPLWFGNEHDPHEENPIYGTSRVILAWRQLGLTQRPECRRGLAWLVANQNDDGGWGSTTTMEARDHRQVSSVEETSLAVEALAGEGSDLPLGPALEAGVSWLVDCVEEGRHLEPAPIGLYFAKLWYYERLYPLIFAVSALGRAVDQLVPRSEAGTLSRRGMASAAARGQAG